MTYPRRSLLKTFSILLFLWAFISVMYSPILSFNMFYEETPIIYLANQKIHSFYALIQVYLHPTLLEAYAIPFFRPTGHFLIYQIFTPLLGWHNTQGFMLISYFFLALCCYMVLQINRLLFPRQPLAGWIACGIYLMHPALTMPRTVVMHMEFAFVFFTLWSLYCFALFCQKNRASLLGQHQIHFKHLKLFGASLFLMGVSLTFKEPALMLGPVMAVYLAVTFYEGQGLLFYVKSFWRHPELRSIIIILAAFTLILVTYITMSWQGLSPPLRNADVAVDTLHLGQHFWGMLFGFWNNIMYPSFVRLALRVQLGILIAGLAIVYLFIRKPDDAVFFAEKKSILFLSLAAIAFLLIPMAWGRARPWHLSLTLVFTSLLTGICFETACRFLIANQLLRNATSVVCALVFGLLAFPVAVVNVTALNGLYSTLNRNAVLHPPAIKSQLNKDSVLVVEDSLFHDSYAFGDSAYPMEPFVESLDLRRVIPLKSFYESPPTYAGTLFRYAYLLPELNEELYFFQIENMQVIPQITIYHWLQHFNNIFCVGYDKNGVWFDKTASFKKHLLQEQSRRHLVVSRYQSSPVANVNINSKANVRLPFPGAGYYCQYRCDSNKSCKGFSIAISKSNVAICYFEDLTTAETIRPCHTCRTYYKIVV
jgi:hypothetical protein